MAHTLGFIRNQLLKLPSEDPVGYRETELSRRSRWVAQVKLPLARISFYLWADSKTG
jgi:hypothetical protein